MAIRKKFWLDRVCVDQDEQDLKLQILQALPGFVAQSTQVLVLWDATYFERLWCNYELAVHAKTCISTDSTQLVPLWMPLWTLAWLLGCYWVGSPTPLLLEETCVFPPSKRNCVVRPNYGTTGLLFLL